MSTLQDVIRSLPNCVGGNAETEAFLSGIADQIKAAGEEADSWWDRWTDFGEATTIYSKDKIVASANALALYGRQLREQGGTYCKASPERNEIIRLLGDAFGLVGARVAVNGTLAEAREELGSDLAKGAADFGKGLIDYSHWIVVGLVAFTIIYVIRTSKG